MITKDEALTASAFHSDCNEKRVERWRRNGATKTWVTRPDDFKVPVKFGLYQYGYITPANATHFHTEESCPNGHN